MTRSVRAAAGTFPLDMKKTDKPTAAETGFQHDDSRNGNIKRKSQRSS